VGARQQASEIGSAVGSTMPLLAADAFALLGQIAVHEAALDTARSHFQEAVLLLSGVGADRAAAQLWFELAGLLESVGETTAALDAYRRAAAATGLVASSSRLGTVTTR
jgi:tetratricopeptide (TPR) repeat protein